MVPHDINKKNNFIAGWYMPEEVCDTVVKYFEDRKEEQWVGCSGAGGQVNLSIKKSTDLYLPLDYTKNSDYFSHLKVVVDSYVNKYPECAKTSEWSITEPVQIQKYNPKEGYYAWHCEVGGFHNASRLLAFLTYLNTLEGGGTEFLYQNTLIKAEKGLTVVFPTIWTHTHRGQISSTDTKIITTGWLNYLPN